MRPLAFAAALAASLALAVAPSPARAEEKMTGTITKLDVAKDGKSAVAVLRDNETAGLVPVTILDVATLQKFERSVIVQGDEIKCKYEKKGKKNVARSFRKAAGCT
jgi:hypothetical protein